MANRQPAVPHEFEISRSMQPQKPCYSSNTCYIVRSKNHSHFLYTGCIAGCMKDSAGKFQINARFERESHSHLSLGNQFPSRVIHTPRYDAGEIIMTKSTIEHPSERN